MFVAEPLAFSACFCLSVFAFCPSSFLAVTAPSTLVTISSGLKLLLPVSTCQKHPAPFPLPCGTTGGKRGRKHPSHSRDIGRSRATVRPEDTIRLRAYYLRSTLVTVPLSLSRDIRSPERHVLPGTEKTGITEATDQFLQSLFWGIGKFAPLKITTENP